MGLRKLLAATGLAAVGLTAPCLRDANYEKPCNGTEVSNVCFDLDYSETVSSYDAGSEKAAVVIYEAHNTSHVKKALRVPVSKVHYFIFLTLEELMQENKMHFIAMEGFEGEFSSDRPYGNTQISLFAGKFMEEFSKKPFADRLEQSLGDFYNARTTSPAAMMFEGTYQEKVILFGMESNPLFYQAYTILMSGSKNDEIVVNERSRDFVGNILSYVSKHPEAGNVLVISTGVEHQESIEECLKERGISYIGLYPEGLERAIELIKSE